MSRCMKIFNPVILHVCILCTLFFASLSFGWDFKKDWWPQKDKNDPCAVSEANVVYRFFGDNFLIGDYTYIYPEVKSKIQIDNKVFKNGEASLRFDLDPDTFSGGAICIFKRVIDLKPYLRKGAVQFWIKGAIGNEMAKISLVDDDSDLKKTIVRLPLFLYKEIKKEWTCVSIPLMEFKTSKVAESCYWDSTLHREMPSEFNWERVAEFRIESRGHENKSFRLWVDDVVIVKK